MRVFGHPLHPALVHFPVAFWSVATILDVLVLCGTSQSTHLAWYCHILGSAMAMPAMLSGWLEYATLEESLVTSGSRHMMLMCVAWVFYLAALFSRTRHLMPAPQVSLMSYIFSICGLLSMIWGGWRGGELVYRYGAGRITTQDRKWQQSRQRSQVRPDPGTQHSSSASNKP